MLVIGDVVAFISVLLAFVAAGWAATMMAGLLFPKASERASAKLENHPWASLIWGTLAGVPLTVIGISLLSAPPPLAKIIGFAWLMAVIMISFVGSAGLARLIGERIRQAKGSDNEFVLLSMATGVIVVACGVPVFGWFFLFPLLLLAGLGAGISSLGRRRQSKAAEAQ